MFYVKLNDDGSVDRYPYTLTDLRHSQPNVSFPKQINDETAATFGLYSVTPTPPPEADHTVKLSRTAVKVNGAWLEKWESTPATPEEIAGLFAFLSSEESSYITGQALVIDGGETAGQYLKEV